MRGTGFEPQSLRFAPFPASNPRYAVAAHGVFAAKCAGPDSNRSKTVAHFVRAASCKVQTAPALRSLRSLMRGTGFEPADPYGIAS